MISCPNHYHLLGMQFCKYPYIQCPYIGESYDIELKIGKGKFSGPITHCMINSLEVFNKRAEIRKALQETIDDVIKGIEEKNESIEQ